MQRVSEHSLEYLIQQEEDSVRYYMNLARIAECATVANPTEAAERRSEAINARDCVGAANHKLEQLRKQQNDRPTNNH